jgi:hypothetical protein
MATAFAERKVMLKQRQAELNAQARFLAGEPQQLHSTGYMAMLWKCWHVGNHADAAGMQPPGVAGASGCVWWASYIAYSHAVPMHRHMVNMACAVPVDVLSPVR